MIIEPRIRGFICVTAHPSGCAANVKAQIDHVVAQGPVGGGPKKVLVIGASTGYGLAARIVAELGGSTSHLASLARERGIPMVLGVLDATQHIPDGAQIAVDGVAGVVRWVR